MKLLVSSSELPFMSMLDVVFHDDVNYNIALVSPKLLGFTNDNTE